MAMKIAQPGMRDEANEFEPVILRAQDVIDVLGVTMEQHVRNSTDAHGASVAALGDTIARRGPGGVLPVGAPNADGHAVRRVDLDTVRTALELLINALQLDLVNLEYLAEVDFDDNTGILKIIRKDGTFLDVELPGLVSNAQLSGDNLIINFVGGAQVTVPLGALIPIYLGSMGTHIQIAIDPSTLEVSAVLRAGTVGGDRLVSSIGLPGTPTIETRPSPSADNSQVPDTGWVLARIGELADPLGSADKVRSDLQAQIDNIVLEPGADGITLDINAAAIVIPAGMVNASPAGSRAVTVRAWRGNTPMTVNVGSITGTVTGLSAPISNNNTTAVTVTPTWNTNLATVSGSLEIPLTVAGRSFTYQISWALARTGAAGSGGGGTGPGTHGMAVCDTASGTAAKEAPLPGFTLQVGSIVFVRFVNVNWASNPTLNIEGTGAVPIRLGGSALDSISGRLLAWPSLNGFMYDGEFWRMFAPVSTPFMDAFGLGWGSCTTEADVGAKVGTFSSQFTRRAGSMIAVRWEHTPTALTGFNVNFSGAAPIMYNGAVVSSANGNQNLLQGGMTHWFVWDWSAWQLLNPALDVAVPRDAVLVTNEHEMNTLDVRAGGIVLVEVEHATLPGV